ncbi:MAG: hypothetical protein Q9M20_01620 [Mariprofundaceae bacterium]|nr:hypothetical protein [Mariprofundaceae bacterium]
MIKEVYSASMKISEVEAKKFQKHCIFLHGWDINQNIPFLKYGIPAIQQLVPFENYLSPVMARGGWFSHRIVYPSQLPFLEDTNYVQAYFNGLMRKDYQFQKHC